jgi:hypothetical protein
MLERREFCLGDRIREELSHPAIMPRELPVFQPEASPVCRFGRHPEKGAFVLITKTRIHRPFTEAVT